jgi:hypothetical protein
VGIAARLNPQRRAEIWTGDEWMTARRPLPSFESDPNNRRREEGGLSWHREGRYVIAHMPLGLAKGKKEEFCCCVPFVS